MEKLISHEMLAAILVWLMPLSAWAFSPPAGSVEGNNFAITGGSCEVSTSDETVDLTNPPGSTEWKCGELESQQGGERGQYNIKLNVRLRSGLLPAHLEEHCTLAGGKYAGGSCWSKGQFGESCTEACAAQGFLYDTATAKYCGSKQDGGSKARCKRIAELFGDPTKYLKTYTSGHQQLGCVVPRWTSAQWNAGGPTTADGRSKYFQRYCACHQYCPMAIRHGEERSCWFMGDRGDDCDETCAKAPGNIRYSPVTATYAGSDLDGGTQDGCRNVISMFRQRLFAMVVTTGTTWRHLGCFLNSVQEVGVRATRGPTTPDGKSDGFQRFCACEPK